MKLRPAEPSDCRFIWELNNEPSVRAQSIQTGDIAWEAHQQWFAKRLGAQGVVMLIAQEEQTPLGLVRFEQESIAGRWVISLAVGVSCRGKGVGKFLIAQGSRWMFEHHAAALLIAYVRPENLPSLRAFAWAGYAQVDSVQTEGVRLVRLECSARAAGQHGGTSNE